jgi:hypothetical protein
VGQRRGFTEERRQVGLVLSLAGISPPPVQPPAGIEIVTWAQRPELARGMYEVDLEIHPDIPGFAKLSLTAPTATPGALKAAEINWALANGYTELHTSNEERNAPINRLNARLGYRPGIGRIHLVGEIMPL